MEIDPFVIKPQDKLAIRTIAFWLKEASKEGVSAKRHKTHLSIWPRSHNGKPTTPIKSKHQTRKGAPDRTKLNAHTNPSSLITAKGN